MNMTFNDDIVTVELLPQEQWHEEKSLALDDEDLSTFFFYFNEHDFLLYCKIDLLFFRTRQNGLDLSSINNWIIMI